MFDVSCMKENAPPTSGNHHFHTSNFLHHKLLIPFFVISKEFSQANVRQRMIQQAHDRF